MKRKKFEKTIGTTQTIALNFNKYNAHEACVETNNLRKVTPLNKVYSSTVKLIFRR